MEDQFYEREEQILEALQDQLDREEFDLILKALFLYSKNIISLYEMISLAEEQLIKTDKEILGQLKLSLETREKARQAMNPFNIRLMAKKDKMVIDEVANISYRKIKEEDLSLLSQNNPEVNQQYICLAMGNEGEGEGGQSHFVKNQPLEELFQAEDEMHEIDVHLQRFEWILGSLQQIMKNSPVEKINRIIQKMRNFKIIQILYGKKAVLILNKIKGCFF